MVRYALLLALLAPPALQAQQTASPSAPQMNARDVFWSAKDLVSVAPNPASTATAASKPPKKKTVAVAEHPHAKTAVAEHHQLNPELVAANGYGARPHLVSLTTDRIGLRYTLLQESDGAYHEVLPSTVFHSGDRVKLSIMANHPGYLYIIQQGSSGAWSPIYPTSDAAPDSNHIEAGRVYEVPDGGAFEFNQQPGQEHVFIVLSASPIPDLDRAIFGLQQQNQPQAAPAPAPAAESGAVLEAMNRVPDDLVQRLASRDLIPVQEQVNTPASGTGSGSAQSGEKAIYVVNSVASQGDSSRVVAKLVLDHQ